VPADHFVIKSLGTFEKNSKNTQWVNCGQIASEPTMYSQCTPWVKPPLPPVSIPLVAHVCKMAFFVTVKAFNIGLVNRQLGGGSVLRIVHDRGFGLHRWLYKQGVGGRGGTTFLPADLSLKDPSTDLIWFEVLNGAGGQESFLNVGVGISEGEEDLSSILPLRDDELVGGIAGTQLMVLVELVLHSAVIGEGGVDKLFEVK
jgi:hypothetical protein